MQAFPFVKGFVRLGKLKVIHLVITCFEGRRDIRGFGGRRRPLRQDKTKRVNEEMDHQPISGETLFDKPISAARTIHLMQCNPGRPGMRAFEIVKILSKESLFEVCDSLRLAPKE